MQSPTKNGHPHSGFASPPSSQESLAQYVFSTVISSLHPLSTHWNSALAVFMPLCLGVTGCPPRGLSLTLFALLHCLKFNPL